MSNVLFHLGNLICVDVLILHVIIDSVILSKNRYHLFVCFRYIPAALTMIYFHVSISIFHCVSVIGSLLITVIVSLL